MNVLERAGVVLLILAVSGCATTPVEKVNTVEMGDNSLSCRKIEAEVKHLDVIIADSEAAQVTGAAADAATEVGVSLAKQLASQAFFSAGAYNMGSLFSMASPSVSQVQTSSQLNAQQASVLAQQRKQHLIALYNRKGCTQEATVTVTLDQEAIRVAQQQLKLAGFDPGPADGTMGAHTRAAIRKYQESQGLPATGKLDQVTYSHLTQKVERLHPVPRP